MSTPIPAGVTIRRATPADHDSILELLDELTAYYRNLRPVLPSTWQQTYAADRHERQLKLLWSSPQDQCAFVAIVDQVMVGFCRAQRSPDGPAGASVHSLCVSNAQRNQGIGNALMNEAIAWCQSLGVEDVSLDVLPANTNAEKFHTSLGFEPFITSYVKKLP